MLIPKNKVKNDPKFKQEKNSILRLGYGQIPKLVMKDKKLSIEAKAIYSYLCSYAGGGEEAFPSVSLMISDLCISESRFYRHFNSLIDCGYIRKYQYTDNDNRFRNNVYEILQTKEV